MALLRPQLAGIWSARDLKQAANGARVRLAGAVICRQRPGTAHGTLFLSLEDETGIANIIVTAELFEKRRLCIIEEPSLLIEGRVQVHENVLHLKAIKIDPLLARRMPVAPSHDFR
jgi:error-prone DNA polymerase